MTDIAPIHSSELNHLSFAGVTLSRGLAEDTFLEFTPNSPLTHVGTDAGSTERYISVNSDSSATINFTLYAQSPENLKLLGMVKAAKADGGRPIIGNFHIERNGSLYLYQPKKCHIMGRPTQSVGRDMTTTTNVWTFDCADLNEIDISEFSLNVDLKADIDASVNIAIKASITI